MIDIHSHILPGIDDGAGDMADSLDLARIYIEAGYRQVVATPHAEAGSLPENYARTIRNRVNKLNMALLDQRLGLVVLPGMEVALEPVLPEMVSRGSILTLVDRKYLLVETPFSRMPLNWWDIVFSLASKDISIIFAHPERCPHVATHPEILEQIVQAGAKIQVNWDSFAGAYGNQVARVARMMARMGHIHCLATDSHDAKFRNAVPVQDISLQLMRLIGEKNLDRIANYNPANVIAGRPLLDMEIGEMPAIRRRKWFGAAL